MVRTERGPRGEEERREKRWNRIRKLVFSLTMPREDANGNPVKTTIDEAIVEAYGRDSLTTDSRSLYVFSRLAGRRWDARDLLRNFINCVADPQNHPAQDVEMAEELFSEIQARQNRKIQPSELYEVLRVDPKRQKAFSAAAANDGMRSRSSLQAPESTLSQPDPDSATKPIDIISFLDNIREQDSDPSVRYIGRKGPPTPSSPDLKPLPNYGFKAKMH